MFQDSIIGDLTFEDIESNYLEKSSIEKDDIKHSINEKKYTDRVPETLENNKSKTGIEKNIACENLLELDLTKIEKKIMKIIWSSDERLHLRSITEQVDTYFEKEWKTQTISTYLAKLIKKGYLSMERAGKVYLYTAQISESEYFTKEILSKFEYFSFFNLLDFLKIFPREAYSTEIVEEMKKLLTAEN